MAGRVTTIGDGAMATVCSLVLAEKGARVAIWGRKAEQVGAMERERENKRYLPGVKLTAGIFCTSDAGEAFAGCERILCAVPTQYIRGVLEQLKGVIPAGVPVISVSKGIEIGTMKRPTEIIVEVLGARPVAAFSGPSIAGEIGRKLPTTMVVASDDEALALAVQDLFSTGYLRVYRNFDLIGVELAGALKNVVAIAAGILDGMRVGNNAKAALLTRGLVEMTRLGVALGAEAETFAGLAGLGDLVTTCFSPEGRNRNFGEQIGRGRKAAEVLAETVGVVEGMPTCKGVVLLARKLGVEMPISEMLHAVLFEGKGTVEGIRDLMGRERKDEGA